MKFFPVILILCLPLASHAAVVINEVAWMGTENSANDEWIELYNTGDTPVTLDGWVLQDGGSLSIPLAGTLDAGAYGVLERTDDNSAPGTAFLIYTGALSNSGAMLSLYRDDGVLEDQVLGGEGWQNIGGDNTTKETAQRNGSAWITAAPTPGTTNATLDTGSSNSGNDGNNTTDTTQESDSQNQDSHTEDDTPVQNSGVSTLHLQQRDVTLALEMPSRAYVHQEVAMKVDASGVADAITQSLVHRWNFGDMYTAKGNKVTHRYAYPGEYMVTLQSNYKDYPAKTRQKIVVLPVSFSLMRTKDGAIQIHNNSKYEVDISGYRIRNGGTSLRFPEGSIILANATITIPKEKVKNPKAVLLLQDELGATLATLLGERTAVPAAPAAVYTQASQAITQKTYVPAAPSISSRAHTTKHEKTLSSVQPKPGFSFASDVPRIDLAYTDSAPTKDGGMQGSHIATTVQSNNTQLATPIEAANSLPMEKLAYFALFAVIGLGTLAVFAGKHQG